MIRVVALCALLLFLTGGGPEAVSLAIEDRSTPHSDKTHVHRIEGWGELAGSRGPIPMLLEEFMIDTSISWFGAPDWQWSPSVAFDGTNYLVVWHDDRNGLDYGIYGTRVTQSGAVLDSRGIMISDEPEDQWYPSVAFNGVEYLVVWQDYRSGTDYDIYGARVHPSGSVLDPLGLPISTKSTRERYPRLAFDGANYLVVWEDGVDRRNFDICAARIDPFGAVLDPLGITVFDDTLWQRFPSVAYGAGTYLVAWDNGVRKNADIFAARVDTSGNVLDSAGIVVCSTSYLERSPAVGFDGSNFLVVWEHWWNQWDDREIDIRGVRVDTAGAILASPSLICTLTGGQRHPSVAFGDSSYLIAWEKRNTRWPLPMERWNNICGAVVDTLGRVTPWWMDSVGITDAPRWQRSPAVAFDGTNHFVVWGDHRGIDGDIYGSRIRNWNVLDAEGLCLSNGPDKKWFASAAFAEPNYLVVWQNTGADGEDIWAARVSQSGSILDPIGMIVSSAARTQALPQVSTDGVDYFIVWEDYRDTTDWGYETSVVFGARVANNGEVLDPSGISISPRGGYRMAFTPVVAFNGVDYLVVWWEMESPVGINAARVSRSGVLIDTLPITIPPGYHLNPAVSSDGRNWLVTWFDWETILGTRVGPSGALLDSAGIVVCSTQATDAIQRNAFGVGAYLVVWEDTRNGPEYDIYGARVDTSGILLDTSGIPIATGPGYQMFPSVVFDGDNYFVVWEDWQTGQSNLWGARVDTSGVVLDSGGVELIDQPSGRMSPSLAKGADNNLLLVFDGVADHPYEIHRVFGALYQDVGVSEDPGAPDRQHAFGLKQSVPNPFRSLTTIRYAIPTSDHVALSVYDCSGRLVSQLVSGVKTPGSHRAIWDGRDSSGRALSSGIYFLRLRSGSGTSTRKMTLIR